MRVNEQDGNGTLRISYTFLKDLAHHEIFERFFANHLLEHIVNESEKYAVFRQYPKPNITIDELRYYDLY